MSADRCASRKTWSRPNRNMLSACRRFPETDSSESPSHIGLSMPLFSGDASFLGHCENHAESRITRHHASIRLFRFFQRKRFDHGANFGEDAEVKGVLCLDRSSRQASNDRAATKDERNSVDWNWIA